MALDPLTATLNIGSKLIDKLFPDPAQKADALLKLKQLEQEGDLQAIAGQIEVNKIEAASTNMFIAGWRPFIGWVCGLALLYALVLSPLIMGFAAFAGHAIILPSLQTELLTTLLVGMLGLGGMRTIEKLSGAEGKR